MSGPTAATEARSVSKVYGSGPTRLTAIDNVSFSVERGEFVALVGPSGSGKTTMLAMLAGLLQPSTGSVLVDGQDLHAMREAGRAAFRRRRIGFTFQANNLVSYLTALENVELMLRLTGQYSAGNKNRAHGLLEMLGLEDRMHALPRQLSGGEQQRVAIARSLINNPAVVLADEPTASLDTERAYQVVETMAHLVHEQGRAAIMVTHDLRMVEYTDRIIHLLDGRLERIITPDDDLSCLADPASCQMITDDVLAEVAEVATPAG
ncbi:MAG: ABC transporter ATP-binding protein [Anaerolineae bacterium]|jgi:putative ABC transport system ATP-binding protein